MNSSHQSNLERFISLTKQLYMNDGSIDILINPDLYSQKYGMTCRFLKSEHGYIESKLLKQNIKVIPYKNGLFRVVDKKTYIIKSILKCTSIIFLIILVSFILLMQFHIVKILL